VVRRVGIRRVKSDVPVFSVGDLGKKPWTGKEGPRPRKDYEGREG